MQTTIIKNADGIFSIASNISYRNDHINRDFQNLVNEVLHRSTKK